MNYIKLVSIIVIMAMLAGCGRETDRRIKLASRPSSGLMRDQVESITLAASQKKALAIFHFDNATGRPELDWLETGVVEMLAADLSQARQLYLLPNEIVTNAVSSEDVADRIVADTSAALQVARKLDLDLWICGSFRTHQDSLAIDVELRNGQNGVLLHKATVCGGGLENVFSMVDRATRDLRNELQLTLREPRIGEGKGEFFATTLEAYKYYTQGIKLVEQFKYNEADEYLLKAVKEDTTFASAYYQLAFIDVHRGEMDEARQHIRKAEEHIERANPREQLYIQSLAAVLRGEINRAGELYRQLTEAFPEDDHAHYLFGNYYYGMGNSVTKAIEEYETAIALNPNKKLVYNMLGYAYEQIEKMDYAINAFKQYARLAPDEPNPYDSIGEVYLRKGRIDDAIKNFETALEKDPNFNTARFHLLQAYFSGGDFKRALNISNEILERAANDHERYNALVAQAIVFIGAEKLEAARTVLLKAYDLNPYDITAMALLYELELDRQAAGRRFARWIEIEKSSPDPQGLGFDKLFQMASFALHINAEIDRIEQLLDEFIETRDGDVMFIAAISYRQIIDYRKGKFSAELVDLLTRNFQQTSFTNMPDVQWDYFWRFYFPALRNVLNSGAMPKEFPREYRDFAVEHNNRFFQIQGTFGIALQNLLLGRLAEAKGELQRIGCSLESNWQVFGPFSNTKGFEQAFWPEKKKTAAILKMVDPQDLVDLTDGVTDGYIDLKTITGAEFNSVAYAVLPVTCPSARTVQLRFGCNSPTKIWLNDDLVFVRNINGVAVLDDQKITVRLNQGENYIKVKVSKTVGQFGFYFRLTDEDGYGFYDISFGESLAT